MAALCIAAIMLPALTRAGGIGQGHRSLPRSGGCNQSPQNFHQRGLCRALLTDNRQYRIWGARGLGCSEQLWSVHLCNEVSDCS
jgi:hypothetical protein